MKLNEKSGLKQKDCFKMVDKKINIKIVEISCSEDDQELDWKTLRIVSFLQALALSHMLFVQKITVEKANERCCQHVSSFLRHYWSFIVIMAFASFATFLVTWKCFRSRCLIWTAMVFQYLALITWLVFFVIGISIRFSRNPEVTESERFIVDYFFACNISATIAGAYNASTLRSAKRFAGLGKIRSLKNPYGDIILEVVDPDDDFSQEKIIDDSNIYDLI